MKTVLAWLYEWMTVIGAILVGGASVTLEVIDTLSLTEVASMLPPEKAVKIMFGVGVIKWACVLIKTIYSKLSVSA